MGIFSLAVTIGVMVLGVSFSILNATPVTLNYYIGTSSLPLSLLLVFVLALGFFLGALVLGFYFVKEKSQVRRLRKKQKYLEQELMSLRSVPLQD